ncbi:hypothetical protein EDD18DRAFT_1356433 [Armillaria luteobubalina]|uniref:Uncharacterized protein n=1 Tax=Armillaria luteobubalina TaxID=153913 RepID=A0AA39TL23_9AGAR|nr:hypothetical protein EDD18DRAFT_1356433 [Armillaria luteobubalina]
MDVDPADNDPDELMNIDLANLDPDLMDVDLPDSNEVWSDKNRWTNPEQTRMLMSMRYCRREYVAIGNLPKFTAAFNGKWMRRYPETYEGYFLDREKRLLRSSAELWSVRDSPADASYPKMAGGFLDLGPDHCLDGCELINELEFPAANTIRNILGGLANDRKVQLRRWFYNHPIGKKRTSKARLKFKKGRVPQAIHLYSRLLYGERVEPSTSVEATKRGLPKNDLGLVQEMTAHAWKNETSEIKEQINGLVEKEREKIEAWKDGTLDAKVLSNEDKEEVIDSLAFEFENIFEDFHQLTGWGVTLIAGGPDPYTGVVRTAGYSFGCKLPDGKEFIETFDEAAASGYIPGTPLGETRDFKEYYGRPFLCHMKEVTQCRAMVQQNNNSDPGPASHAEPETSVNVSTPVPQAADPVASPFAPGPQPTADSIPPPPAPTNHGHGRSQSPPTPNTVPDSLTSQMILNDGSKTSGGATRPMPSLVNPTFNGYHGTPSNDDLLAAISGLPGLYDVSSDLRTSNSTFNVDFDVELLLPGLLPEQGLTQGDFPSSSSNVASLASSGFDSEGLGWMGNLSACASISVGSESSDSAISSTSLQDFDFASGDFPWHYFNIPSPAGSGSDGAELGCSSSFGTSTSMSAPPESIGSTPVNATTSTSGALDDANVLAPVNSTISTVSTSPSLFQRSDNSAVVDTNTPTQAITTGTTATSTSAGADCRSNPQLPPPMDVGRRSRQRKPAPPKEVTTLCGAKRENGPPEWLNVDFEGMQDVSLGPSWLSLLAKWRELELGIWNDSGVGKLTTKQRPLELAAWLDGSRSLEAGPVIPESSVYTTAMVEWWNQINPVWRRSTNELPKPDYSKPITSIRRGGRQGIVTLVFGLYWWGRLCRESGLWSEMVDDVTKAIDTLINSWKTSKRAKNNHIS